jgi:hypothetical protein
MSDEAVRRAAEEAVLCVADQCVSDDWRVSDGIRVEQTGRPDAFIRKSALIDLVNVVRDLRQSVAPLEPGYYWARVIGHAWEPAEVIDTVPGLALSWIGSDIESDLHDGIEIGSKLVPRFHQCPTPLPADGDNDLKTQEDL